MSKPKYSPQFKREAVRALESSGKTATVVARELGVRRTQLYTWRSEINKNGSSTAFPGQGRRTEAAAKLVALEEENARLKEENQILKKAARYFAKECP